MDPKPREQFNIRLSEQERTIIDRLKKSRGDSFNLSGWLRETILKAAKKELQRA